MMTTHLLFDGRVQVYRRGDDGKVWQCAARIEGTRFRHSTGEENLDRAIGFAEEWYLDLRAKVRGGVPIGAPNKPKKPERTFADAAADFLREVRVLAANSRSPLYVKDLEMRLDASILPYFGKMAPAAITRATVQSYVVKRTEDMLERRGRAPARSTILSDLTAVRLILKHEEGAGRIPYVPKLSLPYLFGFALWIVFAIGAQNVSHQPGMQIPYLLFWLGSLLMFGNAAWRALKRQRPAVTPTQKDEVVSICLGRPVQSPGLQQAYDALPGYCRALFGHVYEPATDPKSAI